jgi:hypothetical protein
MNCLASAASAADGNNAIVIPVVTTLTMATMDRKVIFIGNPLIEKYDG